MRKLVAISLTGVMILALSSCGVFKGPKMVVLNVLETEQYCGGAHPADELIEELATPHSSQGRTIYISRKNKKGLMEVHLADSATQLKLKPGKYEVRLFSEEDLQNHLEGIEFTPDQVKCYTDWMQSVAGTFEFTGEESVIDVVIEITCDPCIPPHP